jgi:hypothetical protein
MRTALIAVLMLVPTLVLAAGPKEIQGAWQVALSAEEQAQIDAMKKEAEGSPEDGMAKAMLKAILAASEVLLTIDETTLTFEVLGEKVPARYESAEVKGGGWTLTSKNAEGQVKTLTATLTADGMLQLTDPEGKTSRFKRAGVK